MLQSTFSIRQRRSPCNGDGAKDRTNLSVIKVAFDSDMRNQGQRVNYTLRQLGMEKETAWKWVNSRKGYARVASSPILTYTVTNKRLAKRGLASMTDLYQKINKTCLA